MIQYLLAVIWFFITIYLLGLGIYEFIKIKKEDTTIKRVVQIIMLGLVSFIILSYLLNWLSLIYWWMYILIGMAPQIYLIFFSKKQNKEKMILKRSDLKILAVIILSLAITAILIHGAFKYNYLEDDDGWDHASATYQIGTFHTSQKSLEQLNVFGRLYMDPYPPAYDYLMGALYQITGDVSWTLKFFNSFLIFFAPIFIYMFLENLFKNSTKALLGAGVISILPSFMTHFIWSQTLAVLVLILGLYTLSIRNKNKAWIFLASCVFGALILTQQSTALIGYGFFAIYFVSIILAQYFDLKNMKKSLISSKHIVTALILGVILAGALFYGPMIIKYGFENALTGMGFSKGLVETGAGTDTSGGIVYSFGDILTAPLNSKIDQQTGVGSFVVIIALLTVLLLLYNVKRKKTDEVFWLSIILLIFTIIGLEANLLPIRLFPHRFWVFFSIPIAMLFAEGIYILKASLKNKLIFGILFAAILLGVIYTSAYPKYMVQTATWPAGGNFHYDGRTSPYGSAEINGYIWMKDNLTGQRVLPLCGPSEKVIGMNMKSEPLDLQTEYFKLNITNKTAKEAHDFFINKKYTYIAVDVACLTSLGINETNDLLINYTNTAYFGIYHKQQGLVVLKVNP